MQQSLFCLYRKRKQIKAIGFNVQRASSKVFFHSPSKSQGKRSEENRSRPGADVSCSHLSRLTFGASRATGKEENRGCKKRKNLSLEYEVLEMTETPITVYPERTAVDQHPAFEDYSFQSCS